jgi:hypothetical protein
MNNPQKTHHLVIKLREFAKTKRITLHAHKKKIMTVKTFIDDRQQIIRKMMQCDSQEEYERLAQELKTLDTEWIKNVNQQNDL